MRTTPHAVSLAACFPLLSEARTVTADLDEGWDSRVLILDDELVVRLPRRAEVGVAMKTEARLLAELAGTVGVAAPELTLVCEADGSMAYPLITGEPLTDHVLDRVGTEILASQIVAALRAVWSLPRRAATGWGLPRRDLRPVVGGFRERVLPLLDDPRATALLADADRVLHEVDDEVVIHADLGPAHFRCSGSGLAGIIDWSDACLGDRATDLAWLLNGCRRRLRTPVMDHLDLGADTIARADLLHRLGPWWEVLHGLDQQRPALVASGLAGARSRLAD